MSIIFLRLTSICLDILYVALRLFFFIYSSQVSLTIIYYLFLVSPSIH